MRRGRAGAPLLLPVRGVPRRIELLEREHFAFRGRARSRQMERQERRATLTITVALDDLLADAATDLAHLMRGEQAEGVARLGWLAISSRGRDGAAESLGAAGAHHAIPIDLPLAGALSALERRAERGERLTLTHDLPPLDGLPPPLDLSLSTSTDAAAPAIARPSPSLARFTGRMAESESGEAALHLALRLRLAAAAGTPTAMVERLVWHWPTAPSSEDFLLSPEDAGRLYVDGARGTIVVEGVPIPLEADDAYLVGQHHLKVRLRQPSQLDGGDQLSGALTLSVEGAVPSGRRLTFFDATGRPHRPGSTARVTIRHRTLLTVAFEQALGEVTGPRLVERRLDWEVVPGGLPAERLLPALLRGEGWMVEALESGEEPRLRRWWATTDVEGSRFAVELLLEEGGSDPGRLVLTLQGHVRGDWHEATRRLERLERVLLARLAPPVGTAS